MAFERMIDLENILNISEKYQIITFDVFDTLIIRDVFQPTDIFQMSYGFVGKYLRIIAEIIARRTTKKDEIQFSEIEQCCLFPIRKEILIEEELCRANPDIYRLFQMLRDKNKKIYAISDMYLSNQVIGRILKKSGYDIPLYVSSEYRAKKTDGKLFSIFLKENNLLPEMVLHIGDDQKADIDGAEKANMDALKIEKHMQLLRYTKTDRKSLEYAAFINHGLNRINHPIKQIGYEIVGPIVLSFCQWINKKQNELQFDRLYFLSRDMHFIFDVYKSIYKDDARYLRVSRKSLRSARDNPTSFCRYLESEGCYGNVAIVDSGWVGVSQSEIEKYCKIIDPATDLGGLYIGEKLAFSAKERSKRSCAFLYSSIFERIQATTLSAFLETLIGTNEPQVVEYKEGEPIYDREESRDQTNLLKSGAMMFIEDWVKIKHNKPIEKKPIKKAFNRMFYNPSREDMELLGNLHYEDFKDTSIISFDEKINYWKHPMAFLYGLGDSAWKGAYLKRTGLFYPFLFVGYNIFGTARITISDLIRCRNDAI